MSISCCTLPVDRRWNAIHWTREAHPPWSGRQKHSRRRRPTLCQDRRLWTVAHHRGRILHHEYRYCEQQVKDQRRIMVFPPLLSFALCCVCLLVCLYCLLCVWQSFLIKKIYCYYYYNYQQHHPTFTQQFRRLELQCCGSALWNSLSSYSRQDINHEQFKWQLETFLFES